MSDDLVKRAAVIDAVLELIEARRRWASDARGEINGLDAAMCEINNLPSAEPEIIRCKDCKHRDVEDGFCKGRGWPMQLVPDDGFCDKMGRSEE